MTIRNLQNLPDANFGSLSSKNKQVMTYNSSSDEFKLKAIDPILVSAADSPPLPTAFVSKVKRGKELVLIVDYGTF